MNTGSARLRVLVVENEPSNAELLLLQLQGNGWHVLGPVGTVRGAMALLAKETPDAVVLDYRLDDQTAEPVADLLEAHGIPYVLATGSIPAFLPERFANTPLLVKPYFYEALAEALRGCLELAPIAPTLPTGDEKSKR
ncbi:MAG: response regulator [Tahibacter sp.]